MADGIEPRHASSPVGERTRNRQTKVDKPQCLGRAGYAWRQFLFTNTGRFGTKELLPTNTKHRQYRYGQHDNTHAAEPLHLLAIEQDRAGQ